VRAPRTRCPHYKLNPLHDNSFRLLGTLQSGRLGNVSQGQCHESLGQPLDCTDWEACQYLLQEAHVVVLQGFCTHISTPQVGDVQYVLASKQPKAGKAENRLSAVSRVLACSHRVLKQQLDIWVRASNASHDAQTSVQQQPAHSHQVPVLHNVSCQHTLRRGTCIIASAAATATTTTTTTTATTTNNLIEQL
jgi:hypothetical protein